MLENSQDASIQKEFAYNAENLSLSIRRTLNVSSKDAKNTQTMDVTNVYLLLNGPEISVKLPSAKKSGRENANSVTQDMRRLTEAAQEEILSVLNTTKKEIV